MNENMKISIILPVRNPDISLLKRALESVRNQTYQNFEVLLINDGSSDEAAKELKAIAEKDGKIRLFNLPASGVSAARNFAAGQAEGEVLTYLDGDDMLSPFCLEEAALLLEAEETDALWGGTYYGTESQIKQYQSDRAKKKAQSLSELQALSIPLDEEREHQTLSECIGEPFRFENDGYISRGIAGRFLKKKAAKEAGICFPEGIRILEDAIWNMQTEKDLKVSYVKSVWYYYLDNEASVSNAFNENVLENMETPLSVIRQIMDLDDPVEYAGYARLLMDSLRYVYKCLYGNPNWKASKKEKEKLRDHLYQDEPWKEIGTQKYKEHVAQRDQKKALLFRQRLLLSFWKLTWKQM